MILAEHGFAEKIEDRGDYLCILRTDDGQVRIMVAEPGCASSFIDLPPRYTRCLLSLAVDELGDA